ncbi:MAG: inositol monophosphatase family protein [Acidimicrobiales bacterium]
MAPLRRWFRQPLDVVSSWPIERSGGHRSAPFDPVTEADLAVEDAMRTALTDRFPDHAPCAIVPTGSPGRATTGWIIDPIDGVGLHRPVRLPWGTLSSVCATIDDVSPARSTTRSWVETYVGGEAGSFRISTDGAVGGSRSPVRHSSRGGRACTDPHLALDGPRVRRALVSPLIAPRWSDSAATATRRGSVRLR